MTFDFDLIFNMALLAPNRLFWKSGSGSKTVLGSTPVVEQILFSMFSSIMTFDFDLILRSFLTFWGPNGLFFWVGVGFENCMGVYSCGRSTFVLYVSVNSDIYFYLILG